MKLDTLIETSQIVSIDKRLIPSTFKKNPELTKSKIAALKNVDLSEHGYTVLPAQFVSCGGDFDIRGNLLTTLFGCPEIVKGDFKCGENPLVDLQGGPKSSKSYSLTDMPTLKSLNWITN